MTTEKKHRNNVKNGYDRVLKARDHHGINVVDWVLVRRTNQRHEFSVLGVNDSYGKMQEMKNDEGKQNRSGDSHSQGRQTRSFRSLDFIGIGTSPAILHDQRIRSPCMDYHANQKKEPGRPQNRQGQRLQGMSIGIDILLSQKNLKVSRHMHEDETNQDKTR
jgi:hypothetical protein